MKTLMSQKEKFALYLTPDMKAQMERRYTEGGSRSLTGFIENAINFYLDYLCANDSGHFCRRRCSPIWTAGWIRWRSEWRCCSANKRWSWI